MTKQVDPLRVLREAFRLAGGLHQLAVTTILLSALLAAIFLPLPAAYELWLVGQVDHWRDVPVRLDAVQRQKPRFGKGPATWRFSFTDREHGRHYETGDIEPGDIPFTALGWSTIDATARDYQAKVGQVIQVRRSPEGDHYFLRAGHRTTMTVTLVLCALYWGWLLSIWRKRKRS